MSRGGCERWERLILQVLLTDSRTMSRFLKRRLTAWKKITTDCGDSLFPWGVNVNLSNIIVNL